ncbi:MAG: PAS domain S-box protein [Caulobacteraceae bacterium]|nr:PAS domain S-box protein [Caulobacteraceae bacterium]
MSRPLDDAERSRLLVEGVSDYAIYMLDVNGVVTNWNRGAERIKGYAPAEAIGRHFSQFYTPEDRAAGLPARALEEARAHGRFEAEGWRVRKNGSHFWASVVIDVIHDDDGHHVGFAKITRDISEKRAAQQALAASERQFRLLVAGVVDYALYMLDLNGVITNWNAGAEHIKGYAAEEVIGRHFSTFYTEADRAGGAPMRALQTAKDTGRYEAEGWRVRRDGSLFWASVVIDAIRDEGGHLIGFAKITRDITERRNAQLELQKTQQRLAQSQKLEAIGQLTGGVAHDFNNLLMIVSGQAQLLRKRVGDDPRLLTSIDAIEQAAKRGQDLTRHLLSFARRQRLSPVAVQLLDRAEGLRELLSAGLPSRITVNVQMESALWPVDVDPGEFELALLNMAVNARDAIAGQGQITLKALNVVLPEAAEDVDLEGEFVAIEVRDSGGGIPPDILPHIFDPFFTTKELNKGTGLGLSQVYGFVQQSGGRVIVRSELGEGTAFTFYLPRSSAAPREEGPMAVLEDPTGLTVLLVEDNPEVAEVAAQLLEQLGNEVRIVSGPDAAMVALTAGPRPDLVFSDIVMAGTMNGVELGRRIRAEWPGLKVILATGYAEAADGLGSDFPILPKPYQLDQLSRMIGEVMAVPAAEAAGKVVSLKDRKPRAAQG